MWNPSATFQVYQQLVRVNLPHGRQIKPKRLRMLLLKLQRLILAKLITELPTATLQERNLCLLLMPPAPLVLLQPKRWEMPLLYGSSFLL